jgi:signal transduction histidine kinase
VSGWEPGLRLLADTLLENAARHGRPRGTVAVRLALVAQQVRDHGATIEVGRSPRGGARFSVRVGEG